MFNWSTGDGDIDIHLRTSPDLGIVTQYFTAPIDTKDIFCCLSSTISFYMTKTGGICSIEL